MHHLKMSHSKMCHPKICHQILCWQMLQMKQKKIFQGHRQQEMSRWTIECLCVIQKIQGSMMRMSLYIQKQFVLQLERWSQSSLMVFQEKISVRRIRWKLRKDLISMMKRLFRSHMRSQKNISFRQQISLHRELHQARGAKSLPEVCRRRQIS